MRLWEFCNSISQVKNKYDSNYLKNSLFLKFSKKEDDSSTSPSKKKPEF